jgi:hypothetical protein
MVGDNSFTICHNEANGIMILIPSGICCKICACELLLDHEFSWQNASCLNYAGC